MVDWWFLAQESRSGSGRRSGHRPGLSCRIRYRALAGLGFLCGVGSFVILFVADFQGNLSNEWGVLCFLGIQFP